MLRLLIDNFVLVEEARSRCSGIEIVRIRRPFNLFFLYFLVRLTLYCIHWSRVEGKE
jgi:hypothetical protein